MTHHKREKIAIIGSSIAGLASAIGCANQGYEVHVFGKLPEKLQGGIQLAPNGFRALDDLGLLDTAKKRMTDLSAIEIRSMRTNALLAEVDHEISHSAKRNYASMRRIDLIHLMHDELRKMPSVKFHDQPVISMHQTDKAITLHLKEGKQASFDFAIGADGRAGLSRQLVVGTAQTNSSDYVALRAIGNASHLPPSFHTKRTQLWLGDGAHIVHYPLAQNEVNLVVCMARPHLAPHEAIRHITKNAPLLSALCDTDINWHMTDLPKAELVPVWRRQRLMLIGDAAHFMPPHLAQGAGQTLQDAASLSKALSADDDIISITKSWITSRRQELAPIVRRAEDTGAIMRLRGPIARLRNFAIDLGGAKMIENWLNQVWRD